MNIKLTYYVPGLATGALFEILYIEPTDLPDLVAYWESESCGNVKGWEIV